MGPPLNEMMRSYKCFLHVRKIKSRGEGGIILNIIHNTFNHRDREEELENTKGVIRIRNSKARQHNGQKKKYKRTNNDLQNTTHKTKDRVQRTQLRTMGELRKDFVIHPK